MRKLLIGLLVALGACTTRTTTVPAAPAPAPTSASAAQQTPREGIVETVRWYLENREWWEPLLGREK